MKSRPSIVLIVAVAFLALCVVASFIIPLVNVTSSGTKFWWTLGNATNIARVLRNYQEEHHQLPPELMTLCEQGEAAPHIFTSPFSRDPVAFRYSPVGWVLPDAPAHRVLVYCTADLPAVVQSMGEDPQNTYVPAVDADFHVLQLTFKKRAALDALPMPDVPQPPTPSPQPPVPSP